MLIMTDEKINKKARICIIGAGPSGMSALYQIKLLGEDGPEVECYEKQETMGGQWNFTWGTGTDEYGERIHSSIYKHMWTIAPKERMEFDDYSFNDHFGKAIPSYVPREVILQYIIGRFTKGKCGDLTPFVKFRRVINSVEYQEETDSFDVLVRDLVNDKETKENFSHVIVANGKYSVPDLPDFPGLNSFPGRILHSHDLKDINEFQCQTVLIIGGSYSASDIAAQLIKHGTHKVVISEKGGPMGIEWSKGIEERPILINVNGNIATFKDGSTAVADSIILCTGYVYDQDFLKGNLRYERNTHTELYPGHLYKGTVWTKGGNNKMFMLTAYEEYFNFSLFSIQAEWILRYILGRLPGEPASELDMSKNLDEWREKKLRVETPFDCFAFQKEFALMLCKDINYPPSHFHTTHELLDECFTDRMTSMTTYRDKSFRNIYTGELAPTPKVNWAENLDESVEQFLK